MDHRLTSSRRLTGFSDLLNRAYEFSSDANIDLRLHTHITAKRKNISTHVFRYLLDSYRTKEEPVSALTGLKVKSHFGRPDLNWHLRKFHEEIREQEGTKGTRVGVFFCGAPVIGAVLADACSEMTRLAASDGSKIRYEFRMEVFG